MRRTSFEIRVESLGKVTIFPQMTGILFSPLTPFNSSVAFLFAKKLTFATQKQEES
jgi:hypothetical protein